jgi:hypothetical protein
MDTGMARPAKFHYVIVGFFPKVSIGSVVDMDVTIHSVGSLAAVTTSFAISRRPETSLYIRPVVAVKIGIVTSADFGSGRTSDLSHGALP